MTQPDPQPRARPKYTNDDIEADYSRLHAIAAAFLQTYSGTFNPLRQAMHVTRGGGWLTVDQLRVVSNCLLQDFRVKNMPEPMGHLHGFDAGNVVDFQKWKENATGVTQIEPERRTRFEMRARVHAEKPFWYSEQANSYLIHIAIGARVWYHNPRYYTKQEWYEVPPPYGERFSVSIDFFCKNLSKIPKLSRAAAPDEIEGLIAGGRAWCGICRERWEENAAAPPLPATQR